MVILSTCNRTEVYARTTLFHPGIDDVRHFLADTAGLDPDALISRITCTGVERYGGQPLWCAWPGGALAGLDDALAKSCNVAFANLGVELGVGRGEIRR